MNTDVIRPHVPDGVERLGRRMKMEYVGMASVFAIIFMAAGGIHAAGFATAVTAALFFLFLGLKKKTRDHLSTSLLMFATTLVSLPPLAAAGFAPVFTVFAFCVAALEGSLEKRPGRILLLPLAFGIWGQLGPTWVLGLIFVGSYLLDRRPNNPMLARRLQAMIALSATTGLLSFMLPLPWLAAHRPLPPHGLVPLTAADRMVLFIAVVACAGCLWYFWRRLTISHRLNTILFGLLAPVDARFLTLFLLVATVLLSASVFRESISSVRLRPRFKQAEWYFFWVVLAGAIGMSALR
ncbi:MAG: hypothetical protein ACE5IK_06755 [Acidobacteriota bacterium]